MTVSKTARISIISAAMGLALLSGCDAPEPVSVAPADGGDAFAAMTGPCIDQAARLTGLSAGAISVSDNIQTGGGPLLVLNAAGTPYSCRREDDGSVTVFSEFAG